MTRTWRLAIVAAAACVLTGCATGGGGASGTASTTPPAQSLETAPPTTPAGAPDPEPVLADGRSPVIMKSVDASAHTVTFDLIELYLGPQAFAEWQKDHPGSTEHPPLNGHYERNNNPKLRTMPVATDAVVKVLNDSGDPTNLNVIPLTALPAYRWFHEVFWLTIKGGTVTLFEQQFFP